MPVVSMSIEKVKAKRNRDVAYSGEAITMIPKPAFIDIVEVKEEESEAEYLLIPFKHTMIYKPNIGFFRIQGHLLYVTDEKKKKEILAMWGERKRVPDDVFVELMTPLASRSLFLEANLAFELGIPPPIRLPKARKE
jgi:hypothetical protein